MSPRNAWSWALSVKVLWVTMFAGTTCPARPNCSDGRGRNQAPTMALKVNGSEPVVCARMSYMLDTGFTAPWEGLPLTTSE
jgi:hypothetical protein